jgi:hypothetical protein
VFCKSNGPVAKSQGPLSQQVSVICITLPPLSQVTEPLCAQGLSSALAIGIADTGQAGQESGGS